MLIFALHVLLSPLKQKEQMDPQVVPSCRLTLPKALMRKMKDFVCSPSKNTCL